MPSADTQTMLQEPFTFWFMRRGKGVSKAQSNLDAESKEETKEPEPPTTEPSTSNSTPSNPYESSIKQIATIHSVEEFWSVYDFLIRPNDLPTTTDYHFFRKGIKPTWEDSTNAKGGKWIVRLKKGLASRYWEEVILALIGCQFTGIPSDEVCGAVVSIRYSEDIVSVWNKTNDREITDRLRDGIKRVLQLPGFVHMEYKPHETSLADKSSFRNTQVWKGSKDRERERHSSHGRDRDRDRDGGHHGRDHGHGRGDRDRDRDGHGRDHGRDRDHGERSGSGMGDRDRERDGNVRRSSWTDRDEMRGKKSSERSWR